LGAEAVIAKLAFWVVVHDHDLAAVDACEASRLAVLARPIDVTYFSHLILSIK
jgi:hypothetical protein